MTLSFRWILLTALCLVTFGSVVHSEEDIIKQYEEAIPMPEKKADLSSLKRAKVTEEQAVNQLKFMMIKGFARMEKTLIKEGDFEPFGLTLSPQGEFKALKSTLANTNDITYMIDFMGFHKLENLSNKRSMSLHLYAKPIRSCQIFDTKSNEFITKDLVYNTFLGEELI